MPHDRTTQVRPELIGFVEEDPYLYEFRDASGDLIYLHDADCTKIDFAPLSETLTLTFRFGDVAYVEGCLTNADVVSTLRDGGRGSSSLRIGRLSRGLVSGQIALASGLLAFTLLIGQAAVALQLRAWPFDPDAVLSAQIGVPFATLDDEAARGRLLRALQDGLNAMPGARAAALASVVPGRGAGNNTFSFDGPGADPRRSPATAGRNRKGSPRSCARAAGSPCRPRRSGARSARRPNRAPRPWSGTPA